MCVSGVKVHWSNIGTCKMLVADVRMHLRHMASFDVLVSRVGCTGDLEVHGGAVVRLTVMWGELEAHELV